MKPIDPRRNDSRRTPVPPARAGFEAPDQLAAPGATQALPPWEGGLVDPDALADMQAFNDLRAKRKKQRKRKAWYAADQAAKALESMAPQTAFVEQGLYTETVSASGNLQPVASVSATPEVDGIVGEVLVAEGDAVEVGQTLFTVVNDELDKMVNQAAQGIHEAENGVAQAQMAVDDAYRAKSQGKQAAEQAVALYLPLLAFQVKVAHARPRRPRDGHRDAGQRQAPLSFHDGLALGLHDHGVHEHDGILLALLLVAVDHHEALGHAQLRRGDAAAVVLVHGLGHLLRQLAQALVVQVARLAHRVQDGIRRLHDGDQSEHALLSISWNAPLLCGAGSVVSQHCPQSRPPCPALCGKAPQKARWEA